MGVLAWQRASHHGETDIRYAGAARIAECPRIFVDAESSSRLRREDAAQHPPAQSRTRCAFEIPRPRNLPGVVQCEGVTNVIRGIRLIGCGIERIPETGVSIEIEGRVIEERRRIV